MQVRHSMPLRGLLQSYLRESHALEVEIRPSCTALFSLRQLMNKSSGTMLECCKNNIISVHILDCPSHTTLVPERVVVDKRDNVLGWRREVHSRVADNILVQLEQIARHLLL